MHWNDETRAQAQVFRERIHAHDIRIWSMLPRVCGRRTHNDGDDIIFIIISIIIIIGAVVGDIANSCVCVLVHVWFVQSIAELIRDSNAAARECVCMALNGILLCVLRCLRFMRITHVSAPAAPHRCVSIPSIGSRMITATFDYFFPRRYSPASTAVLN